MFVRVAPLENGVPVFGFAELYKAYIACRRNKRNAASALHFELDAERRLIALQQALNRHTYRPSPCACFVIHEPKLREIFAAAFTDRVVHHLLVGRLEPAWERRFIHDTWAGRASKGLHGAVERLQRFSRQVSANGRRRAWFLKLDVRSLFMTIDREILYRRLAKSGLDQDTDWLLRVLLSTDPTKAVVLKSPRWLLEQVPHYKSLFYTPPGKGLPIGTLTSQFFANVYLDTLDQFVKHELHCRHYLRYMDDLVLLHPQREQLAQWQYGIGAFVEKSLALTLNPVQTRLLPLSNGVDFLGYIVRPGYLLVRRRVVTALNQRMDGVKNQIVTKNPGSISIDYDPDRIDWIQASVNSSLGHFRHANANRLTSSLLSRHSFLSLFFRYQTGRLQTIDKHRQFASLPQQVRFFQWRFPVCILLFQVGRFLECYGSDAVYLSENIGLQLIPSRPGLGFRCGWPIYRGQELLWQLRSAGIAHVLLRQVPNMAGRVRRRLPTIRWQPDTGNLSGACSHHVVVSKLQLKNAVFDASY